MKNTRILSINPGSTSTKIAVYDNEALLFSENYTHAPDQLAQYKTIMEQEEMRTETVMQALTLHEVPMESLSAVVGRGGILPPVKSGGYVVNEAMLYRLRNCPMEVHASNLGAIIAYQIAQPLGIRAYIYDSVAVCEYIDEAYFTGIPEIKRTCFSHALNSRAVAHAAAEEKGSRYQDMSFIVAHLGGSATITAHKKGRMIDIVDNDEGPFSVESCGRVAVRRVLAATKEYGIDYMRKRARGKGGLVGLLGTSDAREIGKRIDNGDREAISVVNAMAYQIAKGIGELAAAMSGEVDVIIITGGVANLKYLIEKIRPYVSFIAPMEVKAGDHEMQALCFGARRILLGQEEAREYRDAYAEEQLRVIREQQIK